ncbi:MAG: amino acid deaminase [Geminicoccaceae bacterium]
MKLDELLSSPVDPTTKGWPAAPALPLREVGRQGWNLLRGDLPLPVALIKASALSHNSRWMRSFLEHFGVAICPHGKTTMAPQLFARQLADGAWGITVATVQQLRVCRRFGVQRVVMANQLVGGQAIREVLMELRADPAFWFACLVDSVELVDELAAEARSFGLERPLQVLLEGGYSGGRTGCRSVEQALAVARATAAAPELALIGIEGFEGLIARPTPSDTAAVVDAFLTSLVEIAKACAAEDLFAPGRILLSAGGSAFFDQVTRAFRAAGLERAVEVVLRSGCYLTHDSKMYRQFFDHMRNRGREIDCLGNGLQAALELWAYVQSTPEPGLAIATLGKRDVSFDVDLPVPEQWFRPGVHERPQALGAGFEVTGLNDQHTYLALPDDSPLRVGDMLSFGISHPCTTFDKWQLLYVVDNDYRVIEGIRTFF